MYEHKLEPYPIALNKRITREAMLLWHEYDLQGHDDEEESVRRELRFKPGSTVILEGPQPQEIIFFGVDIVHFEVFRHPDKKGPERFSPLAATFYRNGHKVGAMFGGLDCFEIVEGETFDWGQKLVIKTTD